MTIRQTIKGAILPVMAAAVTAVVIAGCGGGSSPAASASPTASQGGIGAAAAALKAYVEQVKPIAAQVDTTVKALPDAVKGLSKKPDSTWTTSAGNLNGIATQLSDEATALAALTPPPTLQPVQDAAVAALQRAQTAVTKMADGLDKRVATSATRQAKILAKIGELQAQVEALTARLTGGQ